VALADQLKHPARLKPRSVTDKNNLAFFKYIWQIYYTRITNPRIY
jgi:hypothetical protein